jgi:hypothetical protein
MSKVKKGTMKKLFGSLLIWVAMGQAALGQEASFRELLKMYEYDSGAPQAVKWYDAGHSLNDEARRDRAAWLSQLLGIRTERSDPAGPREQKRYVEE